MIFFHLNSEMTNFKKIGSDLTWEIDNFEFPNKNIALSSFAVNFSKNMEINRFRISTNLIQQNMFNSDGTLYCDVHFKNRDRHFIAPSNYEFWKIDIQYPRLIKIKIDNVNIDSVVFTSITFVIN